MRILTAYITRNFMVTFCVTLVVFVFVMAVGEIFRVIDLFSRGISGKFILRVFSYGMPFSLVFAIPMSVLASAFLIFARMANDREIIAMKACGVSIWQIIQPPVLIATALCLVCIYINWSLAPQSHFARRKLLGKLGIEMPLTLLDAGRFIRDFPGLRIYISKKEGNRVHDVYVNEFGPEGTKRMIRAQSGSIRADPDNPQAIAVDLYQVRIDQYDEEHPEDLTKIRHLTAEHYPMHINVAEMINRGKIWKKRADLTMTELVDSLRYGREVMPGIAKEKLAVHRMSLLVEVNTRLALSFSCYAFVLLGAALGVKVHRKESSIGIAVTLVLVFIFYFFIIIADSLVSRPDLHPNLIVWIPFAVSEVIGFTLIRRAH